VHPKLHLTLTPYKCSNLLGMWVYSVIMSGLGIFKKSHNKTEDVIWKIILIFCLGWFKL
jgi:hypothetical protein